MERPRERGGDPLVASGVGVKPIVTPEPGIRPHGVFGKVQEDGAARSGRMAEGLVQRANSPGDRASEREHDREIRKREPQHCRTAVDQGALHELDIVRHDVGVEAGRDNVIGTREERHEIGAHGYRRLELFVTDSARRAAANGQVRVQQRGRLRRRHARGESVGPPVIAASPIRIIEAFRRAVADCDVAPEDPWALSQMDGARQTRSVMR